MRRLVFVADSDDHKASESKPEFVVNIPALIEIDPRIYSRKILLGTSV